MKVDSWEDIVKTDENFKNFPQAGTPLAYFSKEETKQANGYDKAVVIFEEKGELYIGVSDGKKYSKGNIPFNLLTIYHYINQNVTEQI